MDELDASPPHKTRLHTQKKKREQGDSSGKHGNKSEAPTAKVAMDKLRDERDKWKARAEFLEEKLSDVTIERDICRTHLSDALVSLKGAKQSRREDSDDEEVGGSEMQHNSEDDSEDDYEDDSESSSDSSETSDSSPDRKRRKKGKGKRKKSRTKRKNKKEKRAKKSKHHSRQRVGGPGDVVKRYKEVLVIFQTGKNMAKSFEKYGVDRLTIVKTAAIAELAIAAPEEYDQVEKGGTVADFAQRCEEVIKANQVISATITKMKAERKLLRITKKV